MNITENLVETAPATLLQKFLATRSRTESLCQPLQTEDYVVQPIVDVSPPKWHLGHTSWFFEELVLDKFMSGYKRFHPQYAYVFNSYYESVGKRVVRTNRGNLTRPSVEEVYRFREHVTRKVTEFLERGDLPAKAREIIELGIQHEQQHQELLVYDIKYILGNNPLFPAYKPNLTNTSSADPAPINMLSVPAGQYTVGWQGNDFCYDNELQAHQVYLEPYAIADRLVTNGEFLKFIEAGGYRQFQWWFSEAWEMVKAEGWKAPYHWHLQDGEWSRYSLNGGLLPLDLNQPVSHISYYEAEAYAKWRGMRLPSEQEWEVACRKFCPEPDEEANFQDNQLLEPVAQSSAGGGFWGNLWEWTGSAYRPYRGFKEAEGAVGEYNGKFMINQMVLRGGSCATPRNHIRYSYRNFFHPHLRWMLSGLRLAQDIIS